MFKNLQMLNKELQAETKDDSEQMPIDTTSIPNAAKPNVIRSLPDDKQIEDWLFMKIGNRNTMTEKEYLIGMIMAKHVRDMWANSGND